MPVHYFALPGGKADSAFVLPSWAVLREDARPVPRVRADLEVSVPRMVADGRPARRHHECGSRDDLADNDGVPVVEGHVETVNAPAPEQASIAKVDPE